MAGGLGRDQSSQLVWVDRSGEGENPPMSSVALLKDSMHISGDDEILMRLTKVARHLQSIMSLYLCINLMIFFQNDELSFFLRSTNIL
jgi:hypothetical protein